MSVCPHSLVWVPSCTPFCLCCLEQAQCFVLSRQALCHCTASPMFYVKVAYLSWYIRGCGGDGAAWWSWFFLHCVGYGSRTQVARLAGQIIYLSHLTDCQLCLLFSFLDLLSYLCVCICRVCTRVSNSLGLELQVTVNCPCGYEKQTWIILWKGGKIPDRPSLQLALTCF